MIHKNDLQPGHWYVSAAGQVRKLFKIYDKHVIYYRPSYAKAIISTIRAFSRWAMEDIGTEPKEKK